MPDRFVKILREAEIDLDYRQIEEVLWLGQFYTPRSSSGYETRTPKDIPMPLNKEHLPAQTVPVTTIPDRSREKVHAKEPVSVSGPEARPIPAAAVRVPGVAALPAELEISRALRPFNRRARSKRKEVLDEERTVEDSAEINQISPVFKPAPERWFDVVLVAEDSPSMIVWREMISEFARLLEHQGAFRDVRQYRLRIESGEARLIMPSEISIAPSVLNTSVARRLIIVVTDGVSRHWRDGSLAKPMAAWAATTPVVIAQTLSANLWRHTLLGTPSCLTGSPLPGQSNKQLSVESPRWNMPANGWPDDRTAFPLIPFDANQIGRWARMLMSQSADYPAILLDPAPSQDAQPPAFLQDSADSSVDGVISRYRALVSDEAYDLAVYLSWMPLRLAVMRLVHRAMIPNPKQEQLAEFLVGGLIERKTPGEANVPPEEIEFDFLPGVREALQTSILHNELNSLYSAVSDQIGRRIGSVRDFVALIEDSEGDKTLSPDALHFAEIARPALKQLGYLLQVARNATTGYGKTLTKPENNGGASDAGESGITDNQRIKEDDSVSDKQRSPDRSNYQSCVMIGPNFAGKTFFLLAMRQACLMAARAGAKLRLTSIEPAAKGERSINELTDRAVDIITNVDKKLYEATVEPTDYPFEIEVSDRNDILLSQLSMIISDGPGGALFAEEGIAKDTDLIRWHDHLVSKSRSANILVFCVDAGNPNLPALQRNLPRLLDKMAVKTKQYDIGPLNPGLLDRIASRLRLWEPAPQKREVVRNCLSVDRFLLLFNKVDRFSGKEVDRLKKGARADRAAANIDPVALAKHLLGTALLNQISNVIKQESQFAIGVASALGFDQSTGKPLATERGFVRKGRRTNNEILAAWRPFGVREAMIFLATGQASGSITLVDRSSLQNDFDKE